MATEDAVDNCALCGWEMVFDQIAFAAGLTRVYITEACSNPSCRDSTIAQGAADDRLN